MENQMKIKTHTGTTSTKHFRASTVGGFVIRCGSFALADFLSLCLFLAAFETGNNSNKIIRHFKDSEIKKNIIIRNEKSILYYNEDAYGGHLSSEVFMGILLTHLDFNLPSSMSLVFSVASDLQNSAYFMILGIK